MTLHELAGEYRDEAALIKQRAGELRDRLAGERLCEMEKFRLRGRISALEGMARELRDVALVMEHYYDRGYKRDGRYLL